jgi:hypothetical protein
MVELLDSNILVLQNGNDLIISEIGRDFLLYMVHGRLSENRQY